MGEINRAGRFFLFVLVMTAGAICAWYEVDAVAQWMIFSGVLGQLWQAGISLWEKRVEEIDARTRLVTKRMAFGIAATQWDQETRYFLAREWPEMGVEFGESQIEYILDDGVNTGILVSFLREFLRDSSEHTFADVRNYNDDKHIQERFQVSRDVVREQWRKCTEYLEFKNYLREGSMAGNRTWQWTSTEHYHVLRRRYLARAPLRELK